eukprot:1161976-Pelagomonas_calceolata.AAC.18
MLHGGRSKPELSYMHHYESLKRTSMLHDGREKVEGTTCSARSLSLQTSPRARGTCSMGLLPGEYRSSCPGSMYSHIHRKKLFSRARGVFSLGPFPGRCILAPFSVALLMMNIRSVCLCPSIWQVTYLNVKVFSGSWPLARKIPMLKHPRII